MLGPSVPARSRERRQQARELARALLRENAEHVPRADGWTARVADAPSQGRRLNRSLLGTQPTKIKSKDPASTGPGPCRSTPTTPSAPPTLKTPRSPPSGDGKGFASWPESASRRPANTDQVIEL